MRPARPTQPRCRLTARPSDPLNFAFLSKPIRLGDLPTDAGESTPGQTILSFQVHARQGLPLRHGVSETTVRRRREPPSQTISLFQVPCSARLTRPARQLLKPQSDVGKSLPARQTHPFRLLAPRYRTPSNATCPAIQAILAFSPLPGEVQPSDSRVLISRRTPQEPPGWTTSPFPPTSAKLTHQTGGHARQWDVG